MPNVHLNFINSSDMEEQTRIVIFQRNVAPSFEESVVAWTVIEHCATGDNHPFIFPSDIIISATDPWGNETPKILSEVGQYWKMVTVQSGDALQLDRLQGSPNEVIIANELFRGAITANVYKDDKLLSTKAGLLPQEKVAFEFKPDIWIGVAPRAVEGEVLDIAVLQTIKTKFSLAGMVSADIVMKGRGSDLRFELENIVEP